MRVLFANYNATHANTTRGSTSLGFDTDESRVKTQDAMQPTESAQRRASSTAATAPRRSVGCMAGLLRLLSPYHRHRKRLTAKNATPEASQPQPSPPPMKKPGASPPPTQAPGKPQTLTAVRRRRSCEAPRSPTIAPEYRRASCDSPRPPPPAIVARLMGLEESAPASPATTPRPRPLPTRPPPPPPPEMAAEKRRKLLGALEKCDDDLQTLRRIIAAVRAAELRSAAASDVSPAPAGEGKGAKWMDGSPPLQQKPRAEAQYPSPDSVLDAITSPRFPCRKRSSPCTYLDADSKPEISRCGNDALTVRSKLVKPSQTLVFSGDYCKIKQYCNELHAMAMYHHPATVAAVEGMPRWTPSAAEAKGWQHRRRWGLQGAERSRAMVESVGEVWGQGAGEERWEAGLVGAALERAIMQELVLDVVTELLAHSEGPFGQFGRGHDHGGGAMCRKRLCF